MGASWGPQSGFSKDGELGEAGAGICQAETCSGFPREVLVALSPLEFGGIFIRRVENSWRHDFLVLYRVGELPL